MRINHVDELRALAGKQFLHAAYHALLNRAPDRHGWGFYFARLSQGVGKDIVIAEISQSAEGKRVARRIDGLDRLVAQIARSQRFPFRLWHRQTDSARAQAASAFRIEVMEGQVGAIEHFLAYHGAGRLGPHTEFDDGPNASPEGLASPSQTRAGPPDHAFVPGTGPGGAAVLRRLTASRPAL